MKLDFDKTDWKPVKLSDVVVKKEENDKENAQNRFDRFLKVEHMDAGTLHIKRWSSQEAGDEINPTFYKAFRKGQMLFPTRNPHLRRAALASFDGICGEKTLTLEAIEEVILPEFLPFLFHSESFYAHTTSSIVGSTNPHCRWRDVANFEFFLPPKDTQAELAKLLWAMDDVVQKELTVLERTNSLLKSIYKAFRGNTESWTKAKIKDLMDFNYGKGLKESDRIDGAYPVVSSSGVQGTHSSYICDGPGIVVGRKGNIGQVTWVDDNFWAIDTAYYVSIKEDFSDIPLKFFYYLLRSVNFKKYSIATAVPGLNRDDAILTKVFIPSRSEIREYLAYFETVSNQILNVECKIEHSKNLQKSLINQVF